MKVMYIAFDGQQFETAEKCEKYERKVFSNHGFHIFDSNGALLNPMDKNDFFKLRYLHICNYAGKTNFKNLCAEYKFKYDNSIVNIDFSDDYNWYICINGIFMTYAFFRDAYKDFEYFVTEGKNL